MVSTPYNPSYDQSKRIDHQPFYELLTQQMDSKFMNSGCVMFVPSDSSSYNVARMGSATLKQVDTRNPDLQPEDFLIDNRRVIKNRFHRSFTVDAKFDVDEAIADPTSSLTRSLQMAVYRQFDIEVSKAAVGSVTVGAPDSSGSSISAATDGVITVDCTAGLTFDRVNEMITNFINSNVDYAGGCIGLTGMENLDLIKEVEFTSQDFISSRPIESGKVENLTGFRVAQFAGSSTGGGTITNPILPEGASTRKCLAMAKDAIYMQFDMNYMEVRRNYNKVNSMDIVVDAWIGAMRAEGVRVQILETTI
jgi:hypothetical protein